MIRASIDLTDPRQPLDLPIGLDFPLTDPAFLGLDAELPLLLLPVRLQTRYRLDADPPELRIRIYPDQVHIDADTPSPGTVESGLAIDFWRDWHAADGSTTDIRRQAAWRRLAGRVGPSRAGYLARLMRPRTGQRGELLFPRVAGGGPRPPAHPVLLPAQWVAVGYSATSLLFTAYSAPIAPDLRTGPDAAATAFQAPESGLRIDDGLAWMVDYNRAVEVGMAITVPLVGDAAPARDGVSTLLVVGVSELDPETAAAGLDDLLDVHARTDGLSFVPQGTPTNNTEKLTAGSTVDSSDPSTGSSQPADGGPLVEPGPLGGSGPLADAGLPGPARPDAGPTGGSIPRGSGLSLGAVARMVGARVDPGPWDDPVEDPIEFPTVVQDNATRLASALGLANPATLARAPFGDDAERARSRAMLRVVYEAVLGTFIRQLLKVGDTDGVSPATADAVRQWCLAHVTGGAPYPCLRIGAQPYGVLPVRRSTSAAEPATTEEHVQSVVTLLIDEWRRSVSTLPVLDRNRTDATGAGEQASAIGAILATQPHPGRLFTRTVENYPSLNGVERLLTPQFLHTAQQQFLIDHPEPPYAQITALFYGSTIHDAIVSIDDQIATWQSVADGLGEYLAEEGFSEHLQVGLDYIDDIITVLQGYEKRQRPVRWLPLDTYNGVLLATNTALIEAMFYGASTEWGDDGLIQAPDAVAGQTAADYLADLSERLGTGLASGLGSDFLSRQPLLYQLIDRTLSLVPDDPTERSRVTVALADLAARTPDELEWLLRESLGVGTHRLDAWATSLATARLAGMRHTRPTGIQIGGYGWLTNLTRGQERPSQGFVHAPSMAHATTAALLRSGWHAHGTDDPLSLVAVDARSARVRAASWLLDGVRQGQSLGDLLGYRFERMLHDLHADDQIRPVRLLVLDATGQPDVAPDAPVDGIELLDLYRSGGLVELTGLALDAVRALEDTFDAVNDVGLVEGVHQLAAGNRARATAVIDALATGTVAPPELRAPRIPRTGVAVEHRVVILLDPDAPPPDRGWTAGLRDTVAPALNGWLATLLPPADEVGFEIQPPTGDPVPLRLSDLGLSAVDAAYLVGDHPGGLSPALRTLAQAAALGPVAAVPPHEPAPIPLADFAVLAVELRRAVTALRPAGPSDLRPAHLPAADPIAVEPSLLDAVERLLGSFATLVDDLAVAVQAVDSGAVGPLVAQLARHGLATGGPADDLDEAATLYEIAVRRLATVTGIAVEPDERQAGLERRLAALFGDRIPLLSPFPIDDTMVGVGSSAPDPLAPAGVVDDWLQAVGRVRPAVGRLTSAGLLSELLAADGGLRGSAGQYPSVAGEPWVAVDSATARLSIVAIGRSPGPPTPGSPACGLVVDRWTERVPKDEQVTGVALHYDAPSSRPPQAWLLAVPPDGESWSLPLVLDTLLETLEWAMLRAVGPEDLGDYGRAIPAVFAPGNIVTWPADEE